MPRMTLRAAAMSLLFAAWSMPAAKADDRPLSRFFTPSAKADKAEKSEEQSAESGKRRFALPFGKKADETAEIKSAAPPAKKAERPAPAKKTEQPAVAKTSALGKLKQAVGLSQKEEKKSEVAQASHQAPAKKPAVTQASAQKPVVTASAQARTAAYEEAESLPALGDPVTPPLLPAAPVATLHAPGPVAGPAYEPVPVPNYGAGHAVLPGYPYLNAPLNPCPIPNVPYQVGSTIITNQALYPHELQYPHEYKAMYPPFYYKVRGGWMVTPWGVWSHDRWELQGTEVKVKYRSHYSIQSMFTPPCVK